MKKGYQIKCLLILKPLETDATWTSWGSSAGFAKIDNPDKSGINTSEKVGQYTVPNGDEGLENGDVNGSKLTFLIMGLPHISELRSG